MRKKENFKEFQSKILLFGEYSVIYNSQALSIPYPLFSGKLAIPSSHDERRHSAYSNQELKSFFCDLSQSCHDFLHVDALEQSLGEGLYFDSSIPHGFGLGSSGALCAAIYASYKRHEREQEPPVVKLRERFALMESYFHGHSSGTDPLISYLGKPLLSHSKDSVSQIKVDFAKGGQAALFLVNSRKARQTRSLVQFFLEKYKTAEFEFVLQKEMSPLSNRCIRLFLEGDYRLLWDSFRQLSSQQLEHMSPMIPEYFLPLWESGLQKKEFALKLCGAGGGGFFLGMTHDFRKMQGALGGYEVSPILFFS